MTTLHAYILRELAKTFGLVVLAMSALFTMGGGIYNVMRYEGITTGDLFRVMPMLIPIVVTLTMPLSALFTATIVYGRLAADNELTACRSAGINIHRLFLPAFILSVFVAIFTTLFGNFVIPHFMHRLQHFAKTNICEIAAARLQQRGSLSYGNKYFLTAESAEVRSNEELSQRGYPSDPEFRYLLVRGPTFMEIDKEQLVRFASAEWGLLQFDTREPADPRGEAIEGRELRRRAAEFPVKVTVFVKNGRDFEIGRRAAWVDQQAIQEMRIPLPIPNKISFASLDKLMTWSRMPWLENDVAQRIDAFLLRLSRSRFNRECVERLSTPGASLDLSDGDGRRYEITAKAAQTDEKDSRVVLDQAKVVVTAQQAQRPTRYEAARAELIARPGTAFQVELRLMRTATDPVLEYNPRAPNPEQPIEKPTVSLDNLLLPKGISAVTAGIRPQEVVSAEYPLDIGERMADERISLQAAAAKVARKSRALVHFQLGFCASFLVTVIMGAALGVIFRGGRALAAFGLAFVPFSLVLILMLMGRQLGDSSHLQHWGPVIIWGGLAAMAAADFGILRLGVRR